MWRFWAWHVFVQEWLFSWWYQGFFMFPTSVVNYCLFHWCQLWFSVRIPVLLLYYLCFSSSWIRKYNAMSARVLAIYVVLILLIPMQEKFLVTDVAKWVILVWWVFTCHVHILLEWMAKRLLFCPWNNIIVHIWFSECVHILSAFFSYFNCISFFFLNSVTSMWFLMVSQRLISLLLLSTNIVPFLLTS